MQGMRGKLRCPERQRVGRSHTSFRRASGLLSYKAERHESRLLSRYLVLHVVLSDGSVSTRDGVLESGALPILGCARREI